MGLITWVRVLVPFFASLLPWAADMFCAFLVVVVPSVSNVSLWLTCLYARMYVHVCM